MNSKLLFFFLILPYFFNAQISKSDFKRIEKNLYDSKSIYNYEKLIFKFKGLPKSLDSLEAQHLYYGRNFNKNKISTHDERFGKLATFFKEGNFSECVKLGKVLYDEDPSNLDTILILLKSYDELKEGNNFLHHLAQLRLLTDTIKKSGDGKSEKTAYLVNNVGDEYIFLNILNVGKEYSRVSKTLKDGVIDIWEKDKDKIYIKVLYIDLTN